MKVEPLGNRLLVEQVEADETTKGGIIVPDTAKEKPKEGKVVSVGSGKTLENGKKQPMTVKKGDRIVFDAYAGTEIRIEDKDYLIMREDDVLAVMD